MAMIILPDVDDAVLDQARAASAAQGGSLEDELSRLVEARAREAETDRRRRAEAGAAAMKAFADRMYEKYGPFPSTVDMIREERDSW